MLHPDRTLSAARSSRRARDAALQKSGAKLTQIDRLNAIRNDLQSGQAIYSQLVKAPGSDTFQKLSIAQVIGAGATDAHPAFRLVTKPLAWIYRLAGSDEGLNHILADATLVPSLQQTCFAVRRPEHADVQRAAAYENLAERDWHDSRIEFQPATVATARKCVASAPITVRRQKRRAIECCKIRCRMFGA